LLRDASHDADAARRICDTLRAGGLAVWFDADGGLEHGDEWDLAAERARGIAFLWPVGIDDTRVPDALVPDRFRAVQ
jgi:hypothetical protein